MTQSWELCMKRVKQNIGSRVTNPSRSPSLLLQKMLKFRWKQKRRDLPELYWEVWLRRMWTSLSHWTNKYYQQIVVSNYIVCESLYYFIFRSRLTSFFLWFPPNDWITVHTVIINRAFQHWSSNTTPSASKVKSKPCSQKLKLLLCERIQGIKYFLVFIRYFSIFCLITVEFYYYLTGILSIYIFYFFI